MIQLFESARRVSVPNLVIRSSDQAATVESLKAASKEYPVVQWDAARGMAGLNEKGLEALGKKKITADGTVGFVDAMMAALQLPQGSIVCAMNAHRQLASAEPIAVAAAIQSVSNLREPFKANFRMLVLLGPYGFTAPSELEHDVVVLDDPLPGAEQLTTIITDLYDAARQTSPKLAKPTTELVAKAVEAVSGLSSFAAEQQAAMSFTDQGLDIAALWERKRVTIEQTPGLSVWRGQER